jgi:hypothetical protein
MVLKSGPVMTSLLLDNPSCLLNFEPLEPMEYARLMMMLSLAEVLKVGLLLLLMRSISITCPFRIRCAI